MCPGNDFAIMYNYCPYRYFPQVISLMGQVKS
jgi:hypothetical protein